jgi:hypothetical protein
MDLSVAPLRAISAVIARRGIIRLAFVVGDTDVGAQLLRGSWPFENSKQRGTPIESAALVEGSRVDFSGETEGGVVRGDDQQRPDVTWCS